jgi:hypothetical protein
MTNIFHSINIFESINIGNIFTNLIKLSFIDSLKNDISIFLMEGVPGSLLGLPSVHSVLFFSNQKK